MVRQELDPEKKLQIALIFEEIKTWPRDAQMHLIEDLLNNAVLQEKENNNALPVCY